MSHESQGPSASHDILSVIDAAFGTDIGLIRQENQDFFGKLIRNDVHLYIVADGMGGARGGATAARIAVNEIVVRLGASPRIDGTAVQEVIRDVNKFIHEEGRKDARFAGMGTTVVGLIFTAQGAMVFHVGDSRAYICRGSTVVRLTRDHSVAEELSGSMPHGGAVSGVGHVLTRSLGPSSEVAPTWVTLPWPPEEPTRFLLCTDGLSSLVTEQEIGAVLAVRPKSTAVRDLIELAKLRGGKDNITVCVIDCSIGGLSPWETPRETGSNFKRGEENGATIAAAAAHGPVGSSTAMQGEAVEQEDLDDGTHGSDEEFLEEEHYDDSEQQYYDSEAEEEYGDYDDYEDEDYQETEDYEETEYYQEGGPEIIRRPARTLIVVLLVVAGLLGFALGIRLATGLLAPTGGSTTDETSHDEAYSDGS